MQETKSNTWIEISQKALLHNIETFSSLIEENTEIMCVVKANAYGHGMVEVSEIIKKKQIKWVGVFSIEEALELRKQGLSFSILVLGPSKKEQLQKALDANISITIASTNAIMEFLELKPSNKARIHLKLETGTNRQGLRYEELPQAAHLLKNNNIHIEGAYTHFADIEDTTDHSFAQKQLNQFKKSLELLNSINPVSMPHTACTAAALLFPQTYLKMIRVGIGTYGLWPSKETFVSSQALGRGNLELKPVMTWKTTIAQIKTVPAGEFVGYGRTFRPTRDSLIAVLPVGYADGYSRAFSNSSHVLLHGKRARVAGRICMNLMMIDITDIPEARPGDQVILLGKSGDEEISAQALAEAARTINYEIVTRAAPFAPRIIVE
jgi:alanine racemase